jgi:hypothetical protein
VKYLGEKWGLRLAGNGFLAIHSQQTYGALCRLFIAKKMMPDLNAPRPSMDELDREAQVTPSDRAIAPRFWAAYGTRLLRRLLNAVMEKP